MAALAVAVTVGAVLVALWWGANRRHAARRHAQAAEWADTQARPELWTSAARCPSCRAAGGLLDEIDGELWFTCLACGQRHRREHRA